VLPNIKNMNTKIRELIKLAVANKASDIHLTVGEVPRIRVNSDLRMVDTFEVPQGPEQMEEMIFSMLLEEQKRKVIEQKEFDMSISVDDIRMRANVYYQMGKLSCALRLVSSVIPNFEQLNLPKVFGSFINLKQGFVLVTGPTGHGKSTSVASMLNEINKARSCHMVTIEDPIEYVIKPEKALISQRELGADTLTFDMALRSCLRQDPNVVFVGEMRDYETISLALTVAETGHLVFSTLHTNSAAQTVDRIVDVFPDGSKEQARVQLASVISAVISQRLIPSLDGGLIPAFELMFATPAVRNAIREGKNHMLDNIIQTSSDVGMMNLETSLAALIKQGSISEETATTYAIRPGELQSKLRSVKIK
jgi:twitching motility protein PilT